MTSSIAPASSPQMCIDRRRFNLAAAGAVAGTVAGPLLSASAMAADRPLQIVAFGDSLTAGLGLPATAAFPAQLEKALKPSNPGITIVNAGVSGDTTAAALARFDWAIADGTDGAIVELGANDALRGQPPAEARRNLDVILKRLKARSIDVLLAGMIAPRNFGDDYARDFDAIYAALAQQYNVLLYPFFLDGVATRPELNQGDGLHPNAAGVAVLVEGILPKVRELIDRVRARRAAKT